jgi:5'-phosphate synthase pdxT subunit
MSKKHTAPGVLAFQGSFLEHLSSLQKLNQDPIKVKSRQDLDKISHLIIPGGESTVIGKFLKETGLDLEIKKRAKDQTLAIYGTCAGAILLADKVISKQKINSLKLIKTTINRNAYGSQIDSFSQKLEFKPNQKEFAAVFIRAPKIVDFDAESTEILVSNFNTKEVFALKQKRVLISTFHPELTDFLDIHDYFLSL